MRYITFKGVVVRYLVAFALVCATWNPTRFNFVSQAANFWSEYAPFVLLAGLALVIVWGVFLRATMRSLGTIGIVLALAVAGGILWAIIYYNLIDPRNATTLAWVLLTLAAAVLTAGMAWSHLRRRWAGQVDMDDVDEAGV